jgi:hypothetical protein
MLITALAILYSTTLVGQERVKKYEISNFLGESGQYQNNNQTISRSQLSQYNNQSRALRNLANFGDSISATNYGFNNDHPDFQFYLLCNRVAPSKFQQRLKLGIGISNGTLSSAAFRYDATGRFDTLTSSKSGTETYIDTTYTRQFAAMQRISMTTIQAGYEWHYQPEKRWHWYMGADLAFGISTRNTLQISEFISTESSPSQEVNSFQQTKTIYEEINLERPTTTQRLSGQLGLDFRIGKKDNFFGKSFLRCNVSYALSAYQSELTKGTFNSGFGFHVGYGFAF